MAGACAPAQQDDGGQYSVPGQYAPEEYAPEEPDEYLPEYAPEEYAPDQHVVDDPQYYNDGNSVEPYDGMPGYSSGEEALNAGQRANDMRIKSYEGW